MTKHYFYIALLLLTSGAIAAETDIDVYTSIRFATFYNSFDADEDLIETEDNDELLWRIQDNSRIGMDIVIGNILTGTFEIGYGVDSPEVRKLFAVTPISDKWNILIGKNHTPLNFFLSNQVGMLYRHYGDSGLRAFGGIYNGLQGMIQMHNDALKIALVEPGTVETDILKLYTAGKVEKKSPKLEISYRLGSDKIYCDLFAGYQSYDLEIENKSYVIPSNAVGFNLNYNGLKLHLATGAYIGENIGTYGLYGEGNTLPRVINQTLKDTITTGAIFVAGIDLSNDLNIEFGGGYIRNDNEYASEYDETYSVYVNTTYVIIPPASPYEVNIICVPEIGLIDYLTDNGGHDQGKEFYIGVKWQIDCY